GAAIGSRKGTRVPALPASAVRTRRDLLQPARRSARRLREGVLGLLHPRRDREARFPDDRCAPRRPRREVRAVPARRDPLLRAGALPRHPAVTTPPEPIRGRRVTLRPFREDDLDLW